MGKAKEKLRALRLGERNYEGVTKRRIHGSTDCRTGGLIIENEVGARELMKSPHSSGIFYNLQLGNNNHAFVKC